MKKVARFEASGKRSTRFIALSFLLALGPSCSGSIDGEAGPSGGFGRPADQGDDGPGEWVDGPISSAPSESSRFVRLNHRQWENTVRDLLRLPEALGLSSAFVAEPLRGNFDTNGGILTVSQDLSRDYQNAAEKIAEMVARDPAMLGRLAPDDGSDERAQHFIASFGQRAFRRPLTADELTRVHGLFAKGPELIDSGDDFADGIEMVVSYFLQSPNFVYRAELSDAASGSGEVWLNSYEVASRLSYALTGSMPDDDLFAAAGRDELINSRSVREQATRLVASSAAHETVSQFHSQLLAMGHYDAISKNPEKYPAFQGAARDLKAETLGFVDHVVFEQNLGLEELMSAPYTYANARIAGMYGLDAAALGLGDEFVRVELDPSQRAGLLTQIGFLSAFGEGSLPNSILRGVFVARRVLCVELPQPDKVPMLPPIEPGGTNRTRITNLTETQPCASCHANLINPLGFGLEKLSGVGIYREAEDSGQPIDATGDYAFDGKKTNYDGAVEMVQRVAASQQAHDCYARHWVEYLYGRDVNMATPADSSLVQQAGALSRHDASLQKLLVELVSTEAFVTRTSSN
jgi:hypothetical protein